MRRTKRATDEKWRVAERRRLARFERRLDKVERDILSFMDVLKETAAAMTWSNSDLLEAAIAACHAVASTFAATDWSRIVDLYDMLLESAPSVVIDVNRAFAIAMRSGARAGLDELDAIPEREILGHYPYALAVYADLHASLGNLNEARDYLERALEYQTESSQHLLLRRKLAALDTHVSSDWFSVDKR